MAKIIIRNARDEDYDNQHWIISPIRRLKQPSQPVEPPSALKPDQPSSSSDAKVMEELPQVRANETPKESD